MKCLGVGALLVLAVVAPATRAVDVCDFGELTEELGDVVEPAFKCQTASGYSFMPPSSLPTATQLQTICSKCSDLISSVKKMSGFLPTCALAMDDGSSVTVDKLFSGIVTQCSSGTKTSASASGVIPTSPPPTSSSSSSTLPATTKTPAASSATPANSSTTTNDNNSDNDDSDTSEYAWKATGEEIRRASDSGSAAQQSQPTTTPKSASKSTTSSLGSSASTRIVAASMAALATTALASAWL